MKYCQNCTYWKFECTSTNDDESYLGACRRYPPTVIYDADISLDFVEDIWCATKFPVSCHDDYCGEWKPKRKSK